MSLQPKRFTVRDLIVTLLDMPMNKELQVRAGHDNQGRRVDYFVTGATNNVTEVEIEVEETP